MSQHVYDNLLPGFQQLVGNPPVEKQRTCRKVEMNRIDRIPLVCVGMH